LRRPHNDRPHIAADDRENPAKPRENGKALCIRAEIDKEGACSRSGVREDAAAHQIEGHPIRAEKEAQGPIIATVFATPIPRAPMIAKSLGPTLLAALIGACNVPPASAAESVTVVPSRVIFYVPFSESPIARASCATKASTPSWRR
jgi:hypothetical protein